MGPRNLGANDISHVIRSWITVGYHMGCGNHPLLGSPRRPRVPFDVVSPIRYFVKHLHVALPRGEHPCSRIPTIPWSGILVFLVRDIPEFWRSALWIFGQRPCLHLRNRDRDHLFLPVLRGVYKLFLRLDNLQWRSWRRLLSNGQLYD